MSQVIQFVEGYASVVTDEGGLIRVTASRCFQGFADRTIDPRTCREERCSLGSVAIHDAVQAMFYAGHAVFPVIRTEVRGEPGRGRMIQYDP